MFPLPLHIYFEITALLFSIVFWGKIKPSAFRWFLPYLLFIVIVELSGRYIKKEMGVVNSWLYNISIPIEYIFYGLLFIHYYTKRIYKQITVTILILFLVFVLINIGFIEGFWRFNTYTLKSGSFIMIAFSSIYFIDLIRQEKRISVIEEPMFWVAAGVLLFNTGEFFLNIFFKYLIEHFPVNTVQIFVSINNKLIWVLYTCIIISIICVKRKHQKA